MAVAGKQGKARVTFSLFSLGTWTLTKQMPALPGCWRCEKTLVAKAAHQSPGAVAAKVSQGLLENTSPSALSQLEVLPVLHWQGSYAGETVMPFPAQGPPGVLGAAMRLKHGNNATSASEGFPCCPYPSG